MYLGQRYLGSKGVQVTRQEEGAMGNLAPPADREESASHQIIGIDPRDHSFDELGPEISWVKGGPGPQTGGWGLGQSGGSRSPGGECFAPLSENHQG